jgi:uncharacterized membrane protein YeaQ/YmgE (transglycosylase-associated protein family)
VVLVRLRRTDKGELMVIELNTLGMLIADQQENTAVNFLAWIAIGLLTGFIGSKILNKTRYGLSRDVLLSIVGAIVGGFLSNLLQDPAVLGLDLYSLGVAAVGAIVFLVVYRALFRRRRFLNLS